MRSRQIPIDPRPGRFLLTGSARLVGLRDIPDLLPGRSETYPTAPVGPLLETFVLGELHRQLTFASQQVRLYHYRDRDRYEVDAVLESAAGGIVACEVKAAWPISTLWAQPPSG